MRPPSNTTAKRTSSKLYKRKQSLNLSPEVVEVRGKREILDTLGKNGTFEDLHFSREMWKYCGRRFVVVTGADKLILEGIRVRCALVSLGKLLKECSRND